MLGGGTEQVVWKSICSLIQYPLGSLGPTAPHVQALRGCKPTIGSLQALPRVSIYVRPHSLYTDTGQVPTWCSCSHPVFMFTRDSVCWTHQTSTWANDIFFSTFCFCKCLGPRTSPEDGIETPFPQLTRKKVCKQTFESFTC